MCIRFNAIEIYVQAPSSIVYYTPFFFFSFRRCTNSCRSYRIAPFSISSIGGQEKKKGLVVWGCSRKSPMKIDFNTHSRGISRLEKWVWAGCSMENHGEIEKEAAALAKPTSVFGYALCNQIVRDGGFSLQWVVVSCREHRMCLLTGRQPLPL